MHILFLSCLKATELIEKNFQIHLSLRERLQLKMHKMMCDACSNYEKQSRLIDKGLSMSHPSDVKTVNVDDLKRKINHEIDKLEDKD